MHNLPTMMQRLSHRIAVVILLPVCLLIASCVTEVSPVTGESQAYGYSWQQELQLGKQADADIVRQFGVYDDPGLQSYVASVANTVLTHSDFRRPDTPERYRNTQFTFRVLDSPVVNAMALPGGYVYVTRGLLAHVNDEAQLAVVLGHEIAHVAARHASRQALRAQVSQLGLVAGAIVGQQVLGQPGVAENILQLGGSGLQLVLMKYGRDAEREADALGAEYASGERYAVPRAEGFFRTLERLSAGNGSLPTWQSTHPDPGERARTLRNYQSARGVPLDVVRRAEYLQQIDGLVVGEDPRQGYTDDGRFFHPELRFQFRVADGWQLVNQRAAVIVVQPEQKAIARLAMSAEDSADAAANAFARMEGLQVDERRAVEISGMNAIRVRARAQAQTGAVVVENYFFRYQDKTYSFLGYAPEAEFANHRPVLSRMILSFEALTERARLNVQPARLRVSRVQRPTRFDSLVTGDLPQGFTLQDLAVINQVGVDEQIAGEQMVKLLR
ncbi:MAG: M48 family metalloprotease [Pseudomonadales bacterium]